MYIIIHSVIKLILIQVVVIETFLYYIKSKSLCNIHYKSKMIILKNKTKYEPDRTGKIILIN